MPERRLASKNAVLHVLPRRGLPRVVCAALAVLVVSFAGCATKRDLVVAKVKGRGTERVYPVSFDQAWSISKTILEFERTEKIEEHRSEGYMVTSDEISALTPSTYIGVFLEAEGSRQAKVTIVTRRRTPTQAYAALSEGGFHRKFAELLKLIAAVGPLPPDSPPANAQVGGRSASPPPDAAPPLGAPQEGGSDGDVDAGH